MVILSQAYHLPRAITICTEIGVDAVGVGDLTTAERYPWVYLRGEAREWAANLKMEWDLFTSRKPQQDPFNPACSRPRACADESRHVFCDSYETTDSSPPISPP